MAERSLRLVFENALNATKNVTITIPLSDDTKSAQEIKSVMDVIFNNKDIFSLDIGAPKSAAFVTPLSLTQVNINGL
jgi:hypothetical protein